MARLTDEQAAMADADAAMYAGICADDARASYRDGDWARAQLRILDLLDRAEKAEAERDEARADCKAMAAALGNAFPMKRVHVSCGTASCDVVFLGVLETPELLAVVQRWAP